ncbi:MAG: sulfatase-like hydrolase/transferase [Candidatus Hydrogenedens sp.]|nr:sulfatase-like hydrolase/transferase [Candidatus Hydrogenedentota bacterium]NLF58903.1 sulfatase-like hydrolase/transferase [Candidatus Hydrogenedens sp.]
MFSKKTLFFSLKLAVIAVLFAAVFKPEWLGLGAGLFGGVRPVDILLEMRRVSSAGLGEFIFWMACATGVKLLGISCGILRWKLLLRGQGLRMPLRLMAYQWFMGRAIGLILPGTIGLDGFRLVESSRHTGDPVKCATVIAVEKLTGIIALAFLVFTTFPLGFRYLNINIPLLAVIMACLLAGVAGSLLLLLNPRVIQVLAAVLPVPGRLRRLVNRLGDAVTAYSGSRGSLLTALACGVGVHLGTCTTFIFTFMAIRAENASVADIFFVGPLLITASVLAFTISGIGVRELAFGLVLGATAGHATAILGGHLELWAGELVPFLLSVPLLLMGGRADPAAVRRDIEEFRRTSGGMGMGGGAALTPEQTARYRRHIFTTITACKFGGALAGATIALFEGLWIWQRLGGMEEMGLFWWGPLAYGVLFAAAGGAVGLGLVFLCLLLDRFPSWRVSFALSVAATYAVGGLVIALYRYQRDVLSGHGLTPRDLLLLAGLAGGTALVFGFSAYIKAVIAGRMTRNRPAPLFVLGVAVWLLLIGFGAALSPLLASAPEAAAPAAPAAAGPNIILCAADALRADHLGRYNPQSPAKTPALDAFAGESVLFKESFSQASWTKPSFGTMFTGRYPEGHKATTKTAVISPEVPTLAGILSQAGYHAQGFSNNPNTMALFGFNRGFSDYVDLKPDILLGAPASGAHLSLYQVMRRVYLAVEGKLRGGKLRIANFYQPAESVTRTALNWLDGPKRPKDRPFYLYVHYMDTHDPFMDHARPGVGYARARMERPDPDKFLEPMKRAYASEVEYMDRHLGALFEGLRERGLWDNTLVVFVSDHGEEFYDHGGWWHGQTLYEELLRVPLIVKLPGGARAGLENNDFARLVDLAPTMLHFAGLPPDPGMQGQSLFGADGNPANADIHHSYAENDFENNVLQSLRGRDHALIQANPGNPRGTKPLELYDMRSDPAQQRDFANDAGFSAVLGTLKTLLERYRREILENAPQPGADAELSTEEREQLESIGYAG